MKPLVVSLTSLLRAYARTVATAAAVLVVVTGLVGVRQFVPAQEKSTSFSATQGTRVGGGGPKIKLGASPESSPGEVNGRVAAGGSAGVANRTLPPGTITPEGTIPPGVTDTTIEVAYYWKGDRTKTSPYLQGSGQEGNVDEAEAFRALIEYINKHSGDGARIFGLPFDLHGRKLKGVVLEAGQYPDTYAATAQTLVKEIKPFVAISSHGSLSAYICPTLAANGVHNIATYDLAGRLTERTNGYCMPSGMSWDRQVEYTKSYLAKNRLTPYAGAAGDEKRVYGFLYSEYPGLVDSAPVVIRQLRAAGVPIAETATMSTDLATAQQQVPGIIAKFRAAGVNTMIMPDAGAPLNFTHGAQANGYTPDYYIWPCSGQDSAGMVRLFNAAQWNRASGLTCYDYEINADLTNDDRARQTEWYRQYQEVRGDVEPPAPTPIVYQSLFQLVAGITKAGPALTVETFRAGLSAVTPYRYDAIEGVTTDPSNITIGINAPDRTPVSDVAKLYWSNAERTSGNASQGFYVYPEKRRYARGARF